ncbi:hypothetical protein ACWERV_22890 [Streptomyces sp. NPDC004031]
MTHPLKTWTVIGLRLDVEPSTLLVAAVLPGSHANDIALLCTSEDDFTRWAANVDAPDADAAAAQACATPFPPGRGDVTDRM